MLLVLATTGLIYLFRFQIEPLLHHDLMRVEQQPSTIAQPYSAQLAAVENAFPDGDRRLDDRARRPGREHGASRSRCRTARPATPTSTRTARRTSARSTRTPRCPGYAVRLHGELMAGHVGRPGHRARRLLGDRDGADRLLPVREGPAGRRRAKQKLRSRHGYVGLFVGLGLLTLVVTGLPWTGIWGDQGAGARHRAGHLDVEPRPRRDQRPDVHARRVAPAQPRHRRAVGDGQVRGPDGPRRATAATSRTSTPRSRSRTPEGLRHPMTVALPSEDDGVFSVIGYAFDAPTDERTVHVDRYGGGVVSTYGFDDYPDLAKVVSLGIGLHEGRSLGLWSFWGSALMCLAVIFMCVTGPLMWWRRRPTGAASIGAPRGRMPLRATPLLVVALVALGVLLPVFGISLLAVLLLDQLVLRRVPALSALVRHRLTAWDTPRRGTWEP